MLRPPKNSGKRTGQRSESALTFEPIPSAAVLRLRKAWGVAEPELHVVPSWIRARVTAATKSGTLPARQRGHSADAWHSLQHAISTLGSGWLDHYGRIRLANGTHQLISEPYGLVSSDVQQLERFCSVLGLKYYISPVSWWFPSETIRIVITEPD